MHFIPYLKVKRTTPTPENEQSPKGRALEKHVTRHTFVQQLCLSVSTRTHSCSAHLLLSSSGPHQPTPEAPGQGSAAHSTDPPSLSAGSSSAGGSHLPPVKHLCINHNLCPENEFIGERTA